MTPSVTRLCLSAIALALPLNLWTADQASAQSSRRGKPAETGEGKVAPKQEKQFPLGQTWTAISLNGKPIGGSIRPSLQIDENLRGTGYAGCNTFSATTYPLRQQNFATGPVAVTRRTCDAGASAVERSFLVALRGARTWDVLEGRLIISGAGGELVFERGI